MAKTRFNFVHYKAALQSFCCHFDNKIAVSTMSDEISHEALQSLFFQDLFFLVKEIIGPETDKTVCPHQYVNLSSVTTH